MAKIISIIVPVHNEEKNIPLIEAELSHVLAALPYSHEIIFVKSHVGLSKLLDHQPDAKHRHLLAVVDTLDDTSVSECELLYHLSCRHRPSL